MKVLTKIFSSIFFVFGLILIASSFEGIERGLLDIVVLLIGGIVFLAVGVIGFLWHEPIDDEEEEYREN